jgi:hypothetical protein
VSSDLYALQLERFQQRSQDLEQQIEALHDELRSFARLLALTQGWLRLLGQIPGRDKWICLGG